MSTSEQYIPGVCNIGRAEMQRRWRLGWGALVVALLYLAVCVGFRFAPAWRLLVFLPALLSALGFIQHAWHFCAKFGLGGVFNFGPQLNHTDTVEQAEFRRKDRRTAIQIIVMSVVIAIVVAVA